MRSVKQRGEGGREGEREREREREREVRWREAIQKQTIVHENIKSKPLPAPTCIPTCRKKKTERKKPFSFKVRSHASCNHLSLSLSLSAKKICNLLESLNILLSYQSQVAA
jgi:hypothetical protein